MSVLALPLADRINARVAERAAVLLGARHTGVGAYGGEDAVDDGTAAFYINPAHMEVEGPAFGDLVDRVVRFYEERVPGWGHHVRYKQSTLEEGRLRLTFDVRVPRAVLGDVRE
jgi:hypothetical protein